MIPAFNRAKAAAIGIQVVLTESKNEIVLFTKHHDIKILGAIEPWIHFSTIWT
jgi:hypothetical protein